MRILMISDVYFPRVNGVSTSTATFISELKNQGHQVTLIAPQYSSSQHVDHDTKAGIIRIPSRKVLFDPEDRFMRRKYIHALRDELRDINFDVIHIQTPFVAHYLGMWLARELDLPTLETYHTFFEEYLFHYLPLVPKKWMRHFAKHFTLKQCNQTDHVIVPSTAMQEVLLAYGVTSAMTVLPTGIPLREFGKANPKLFRKEFGIEDQRPLITTVGRVAFEKNLDFLLDVVATVRHSIPDILFLVAGEGPMRKHLKKRVSKEGLEKNVLFVGYLDRQTGLQACYQASDIFIFASRTETQGLVLLEAMAEGVPVVSTAVMGTRDVLQEGQGCLIADEDTQMFAEKIVKLLKDPDRMASLSVSGREYVQQWTAGYFAGKLAGLYQRLAQSFPVTTETDNNQVATSTNNS